ncbi:MAG TPA: hypothetical protein PK689_08420 [Kiritimatiellia bacterium]|nr:hypothetical protein [Kiritimatiellia bacterium]
MSRQSAPKQRLVVHDKDAQARESLIRSVFHDSNRRRRQWFD